GRPVLLDDGVIAGIGFDDDAATSPSALVSGPEAEVDDFGHDAVGQTVHGPSGRWGDEQVHSDVSRPGGQHVLRDEAVRDVGLDVEAVGAVDGPDPAGLLRRIADALQVGPDPRLVEVGHHPVVGARMAEPFVDPCGVPVDVERSDGHPRRGGRQLDDRAPGRARGRARVLGGRLGRGGGRCLCRVGDEFGGHACDISLESSRSRAAAGSSSGTPKVWNAIRYSIGYGSRPVTRASTTEARQGPKPRSGAVTPWVCSWPLRKWLVPSWSIVSCRLTPRRRWASRCTSWPRGARKSGTCERYPVAATTAPLRRVKVLSSAVLRKSSRYSPLIGSTVAVCSSASEMRVVSSVRPPRLSR